MISKERQKLYNKLKEKMYNMPLVKYEGEVPNNNEIYIKRQCDSLFGSHYDLVYLGLFEYYEKLGKIKPGDEILETSSGSAGASCAGIGKFLGYKCHLGLPAGGEKAREEAIKKYGAKLYLTDREQYVNAFPNFVIDFLKDYKEKGKKIFYLNHSMGRKKKYINLVSLKAIERIAKESLRKISFDYFVVANGNGTSLYGAGRIMKKANVKVIAFEPFQSALLYDLIYPGKYKDKYGINPGTLSRHVLPGTSYQKYGITIPIPHTKAAVKNKIVDEVILFSDNRMDKEYLHLTKRKNSEELPHWDTPLDVKNDFGRSTKAGINVCKYLSKDTKGKRYLIIGYDKAERYDDFKI